MKIRSQKAAKPEGRSLIIHTFDQSRKIRVIGVLFKKAGFSLKETVELLAPCPVEINPKGKVDLAQLRSDLEGAGAVVLIPNKAELRPRSANEPQQ